MAKRKGINLISGEKWSIDHPGYIDKGNGLFRKPKPKINEEGITVYKNSYYILKNCFVCNKVTLKDKSNLKSSSKSVCSAECFHALKIKPDGSKKFKRGNNSDHVMVKQKQHPNANIMGDVAEHRLVMEKNIKRYLKNNEYVHHINLIKGDNRIENLVLFDSHSGHFKAHGSLNKCVAILIEKKLLTYNRLTNLYEVV